LTDVGYENRLASMDNRLTKMDGRLNQLTWMVGFVGVIVLANTGLVMTTLWAGCERPRSWP
jgi:hypothetical protein